MKIVFDDPNTTNNLLILDCNIPLRNNAFARQALLYASRIFFNWNIPLGMKPLCGLRCQFAVFPEFQNFHSVSFLLISALFRTALVDIVLVLAPWAAKCGNGPPATEHILAELAQQTGFFVVQPLSYTHLLGYRLL